MSHGLAVAGDARVDLDAMDSWLQEEFWDELERLAADPTILPARPNTTDIFHEFARDSSSGQRHFITLTLSRNDLSKTLKHLGIDYRQMTSRP